MTKRQKRELIRVLANDCQLEGTYRKGSKTCAIGAMLLASTKQRSAARRAMNRIEGYAIDAHTMAELNIVRGAIAAHFGITEWQMFLIQRANDSVVDSYYDSNKEAVKDRRQHVLKLVRKFRTSRS